MHSIASSARPTRSRTSAPIRDHIEPHLDAETRDFWEGRGAVGRRRIALFSANIYRRGLLGRFIGAGHLLARLYGVDPADCSRRAMSDEQRAFFDSKIAPLFDKRLRALADRRPASLFGLGIPPAQYRRAQRPARASMAAVLRARLERLACGFDSRQLFRLAGLQPRLCRRRQRPVAALSAAATSMPPHPGGRLAGRGQSHLHDQGPGGRRR